MVKTTGTTNNTLENVNRLLGDLNQALDQLFEAREADRQLTSEEVLGLEEQVDNIATHEALSLIGVLVPRRR